MKRLSVGFQGTVDHRHRVKIQRRDAEGCEIFARDNFTSAKNERNGFVHRIVPLLSFDSILTKTICMTRVSDNKSVISLVFSIIPPHRDERDGVLFIGLRNEPNITRRRLYNLENSYMGITRYRRTFRKSPSIYPKLYIGTYVHTCLGYVYIHTYIYAAAPVYCVCLVYLFYFILVYLGKAMSRGYIVVRKYQGVQHLQFSIRRRRTHLHIFLRGNVACARALYRVYTHSASSLFDIGCLCDSEAN